MSTIEQLARMLPGAVDLEGVASTLRGLSGPELAGALAGIGRPQTLALLATYLADDRARSELVYWLCNEAAKIGAERKWVAVKGSELSLRMARLAVREVCDAPRCTWCHGVAEVQAGDQRIECDGCGGTGRQRLNVEEALGYGGQWVERYEVVRHALLAWLADAVRIASAKLDDFRDGS